MTPATICDHINPHRGDVISFFAGPFQSLCKQCHDTVKQSEEVRGYRGDADEDGWPTDPRHPVNTHEREGASKSLEPLPPGPAAPFRFKFRQFH
jgi:hypothetical protein